MVVEKIGKGIDVIDWGFCKDECRCKSHDGRDVPCCCTFHRDPFVPIVCFWSETLIRGCSSFVCLFCSVRFGSVLVRL